MIKFFRIIRQRLLSENKFSKYLLYAIGEIVLVVVGILIALQINNWNERTKEISKSRNYLVEFQNDLITDTININRSINAIKKLIDRESWVLNKTIYSPFESDSILMALQDTYFDRKINNRTFSNVQNSGNSKLIGYDSLFSVISHYYIQTNFLLEANTSWDVKVVTEGQSYLNHLKETIEKDNNFIKRESRISDIPDFPMITDPAQQAMQLIAFATSIQGRNHFRENYARHLRLLNIFIQTKHEANDLIRALEKELKQ